MSYLSELKRELREKGKLENTTFNTVRLLEQSYLKDNPQCAKCTNTTNLTYDHIIPRSILSDFNIDAQVNFWEENSQTLCHACNKRKGNSLDLSNQKTKPLLLQLLK